MSRYNKTDILNYHNSGHFTALGHNIIMQQMNDIEKLTAVLKDAVRIYGKYNTLINEPGKPGEWITSAHEVLDSVK